MKIIKEYLFRNMKKIEYDFNDSKLLKERFKNINPTVIDRLCFFMSSNDIELTVTDCYDSQSGWEGENFVINNHDMSGNGYCLSDGSINDFLSHAKNYDEKESRLKFFARKLCVYGKVGEIIEEDELIYIKITTGFSDKLENTIEIMKLIQEITNSKFPNILSCKTDKNLFELTLVKK